MRRRKLLALADVDNLVADQSGIFCSVGSELFALRKQRCRLTRLLRYGTFDKPISALASDGGGGLAVALDGQGLVIHGRST